MTFDMAQSARTMSSSFNSSSGNDDALLQSFAAASNGDDYDSDGSNFAPP